MSKSKPNGSNKASHPEQNFGIDKIYTKNISFESPHPIEIFQSKNWEPMIHLDLQTHVNELGEDAYEVTLTLTATAKIKMENEEKTAFLVEVEQAGIFYLTGFPKEQLKHMLGSFCPNILFPYGREVISNLVNRGGYPPLYLAPVNFDALYQHHLQQAETKHS